ncbi:hypothetical protein D9756_006335 [Leucocoprinus leucothites]|uniref:Uncharacterized protein n=1 Tax=Leucocoprinus leucothites TaxID=201217 RepID=A0A8H5FWR9_9AGAR|nr:hypothetical protein D9756_006335 [Leucoagaricus leucothites]
MSLFNGIHSFILDDLDGPQDGQDNHQDAVNQAMETARLALDNVAKPQRSTRAGIPGASGPAIPAPPSSSLVSAGGNAMDIRRALGFDNQSLAPNAGGAFGATFTGIGAEEKTKRKARVTEMRRQLDDRKARKEQKITNGEGHFGRKSQTPDQRHPVWRSQDGGLAAITAPSEIVNSPRNQGQWSLLSTQATLPRKGPSRFRPTLPPQLQGPPPNFDPSNTNFHQLAPIGGPGPFPPFSMMPNGPPGSFPPMNMNFSSSPNFHPSQAPIQNGGGMSTYPPPQPTLAAQQHNDSMPTTEREYAITAGVGEELGEMSKEDDGELREDGVWVPDHTQVSSLPMNTIASPAPQAAVGSATTLTRANPFRIYPYPPTYPGTPPFFIIGGEKRRRSSPIPSSIALTNSHFSGSELRPTDTTQKYSGETPATEPEYAITVEASEEAPGETSKDEGGELSKDGVRVLYHTEAPSLPINITASPAPQVAVGLEIPTSPLQSTLITQKHNGEAPTTEPEYAITVGAGEEALGEMSKEEDGELREGEIRALNDTESPSLPMDTITSFVPQVAVGSEMPTSPPQSALVTQKHNGEAPTTKPEYAITVGASDEAPGETSKEEDGEPREDEIRVLNDTESPSLPMDTIASFVPQAAVGSEMPTSPPQSTLVAQKHNGEAPITEPEYAITVGASDEVLGEMSKEEDGELREGEIRVLNDTESPSLPMDTIASPVPQPAIGSEMPTSLQPIPITQKHKGEMPATEPESTTTVETSEEALSEIPKEDGGELREDGVEVVNYTEAPVPPMTKIASLEPRAAVGPPTILTSTGPKLVYPSYESTSPAVEGSRDGGVAAISDSGEAMNDSGNQGQSTLPPSDITRPDFGSETPDVCDPTVHTPGRAIVERNHSPSVSEHLGGPSAPVEINEDVRYQYQGHSPYLNIYTTNTDHQTLGRSTRSYTPASRGIPPSSLFAGAENWTKAPQAKRQHDHPYSFPAGSAGYGFNPWHWESANPQETTDHDSFASHYSFVVTTAYNVVFHTYLAGHLLIPSLYFFRANQIFRDAGLSVYQIAHHAAQSRSRATEGAGRSRGRTRRLSKEERELGQEDDEQEGDGPSTVPQFRQLKNDWENMIGDLVEEWRTLNIVSAMMVPGILTLFQVDGAVNDPVTRSLAHWSLIMALWSIVYGCLYIIQFRRMRTDNIIIGWAMETEKPHIVVWNTWFLLALPVVFLAWSILIFITAIIWFMWRTRASPPLEFSLPAPPLTESAFRVLTSVFLVIAIIYLVLALSRFFQCGAPMTGHWKREVEKLIAVVAAQSESGSPASSPITRGERRSKARARHSHDNLGETSGGSSTQFSPSTPSPK